MTAAPGLGMPAEVGLAVEGQSVGVALSHSLKGPRDDSFEPRFVGPLPLATDFHFSSSFCTSSDGAKEGARRPRQRRGQSLTCVGRKVLLLSNPIGSGRDRHKQRDGVVPPNGLLDVPRNVNSPPRSIGTNRCPRLWAGALFGAPARRHILGRTGWLRSAAWGDYGGLPPTLRRLPRRRPSPRLSSSSSWQPPPRRPTGAFREFPRPRPPGSTSRGPPRV